MARASVILKIPMSDVIDADGAWGTKLWDAYRFKTFSVKSDDATEDYKTISWVFTVKLNLPETCIVTSVRFPLQIGVTKPETDGLSFAVVVDGTQYTVDSNGNVADSNFVAKINNYKAQHGVFPELTFNAGAWILKPAEGTSYARFQMSNPVINCTLEGGSSSLFRPTADISVGHEIPSGFSHVYQLIDDETADDDSTCIASISEGDSAPPEVDKTSIVTTNFSLPPKTNLVQLRLILRAYLDENGIASGCVSTATVILSSNDSETTCEFESPDVLNIGNFISYKEYNTIEQIINKDSPLIEAINSYYQKHNTAPELQISLNTYADGIDSEGYKGSKPAYSKISQVYLEAVYEKRPGISVYCNEGGTWKQAQTAYKKQNGTWVENTEEECKNVLQNNNIRCG